MKKIVATTLALGMITLAGNAMATPVTFDVDGATDSYVNLSNITTIGSTTISADLSDLGSLADFTLNDGESNSINFFTFSVTGAGLGFFDIEANLNFDSPDVNAGSDGSGGWGTVTLPWWVGGGTLSGGIFSWDNASQDFLLSDGNTVNVTMDDGFALGAGSNVDVYATIKNLGGGTEPVPEPATMLLMGTGLLGLVGYSRKRSNKKS